MKVRKALAFFLIVCMMATFIPAAFADEGSEGEKVDITISESGTEVVLSVDQQEVRKDGSINGVNIITDENDNTLTTAVAVDTSGHDISKTVSNTGTVEATVNGDVNGSVKVMSDDPQTADTTNTEITLTVNGDITSEGNYKYGLKADSYTDSLEENTSNTNVTVKGNVSASGEESPGVTTVTYANADKTTAETAVTVNGSVKSEDTGIKITSYATGNGASANTSVTVGEDVAAKADGRSVQGVNIRNALTNAQATNVVNVEVDGEVSAEGASATGIQVKNDKADVTVTAGSVTATAGKEGKATAIDIYGGAKGAETQVTVNGDVVSSDVGVRFESNAGGDVAVIIEGELQSVNEALDVTTPEGAENTVIAVTAIKDENGEKAENIDEKIKVNGSTEGEAVSNFAKGIYYIVNKAGVGQNISVTGTKTITQYDGEVAQEMDEITMTADGDGTLEDVSAGDYAEVTKVDAKTFKILVKRGGDLVLKGTYKAPEPAPGPAPEPAPVEPSADTGSTAANDWAPATVKLLPENNGAYTVFLSTKVPNITFLRQTLTNFTKYSDKLIIDTPYGVCEISLSELLNFNEKAVNFRIVVTDTAVEIYVNGELFRSIPLSELV